jgi:hypothetical protein
MARAFFSLAQRLTWRHTVSGFDSTESLDEPSGSLAIRSGAMQIGEALLDILLERSSRRARFTDDIRMLVRGLNRSTQRLILDELMDWPPEMRDRWTDSFGWPSRTALGAARVRVRRDRVRARC